MKNKIRKISWNLELTVLVAFSAILVVLIASTLASVATLRNTLASKGENVDSDVDALIEVEKIRTLAEVKASDARGFFLLGSKALFDEHKQLKQDFESRLANFEKQHPLPRIPEIINRILSFEQQQQEAFDQSMKFREQKTESKIVGQFFQSKVAPIRKAVNSALDEIAPIAKQEMERARAESLQIAPRIESQITRGISVLLGTTVFLVFGLMLLVIRMLFQRGRHQTERDRLFHGAKKAHQARDELMVAISNDLKDPLFEIAQNAESLTGSAGPDSAIESIKRSVSMTENVIRDILDQAKADEGNLTLRLEQLGVNDFLADARFMLEPLAKRNDVRLQIDSGNPPVLAFFDRERIVRVLSNLVGNAVKFSPKHSKVTVKVRGDQQFAYISVTDSGPGIPEKHHAQLFDNYWQAPRTADQGTGVGLAIVKTIIEAHGGTVRVDSHPGNGSTFTISLPRRRPAGAVLAKSKPAIKSTLTHPGFLDG